MKKLKWLSFILDILCAIIWTVELIMFFVIGTISPAVIATSLIVTILYFVQLAIFDFSKK